MSETVRHTGFVPLPPLIYLAALVVGIVLGVFVPPPWIGGILADILLAFGWIAVVAALALWFGAVRTMRRAGTTLNPKGTPEHLLTGGPFAVSRNPIYLAATLLMIGIALVTANVWTLLMAFVAAFLTGKLAVEYEEKILAQRFGKKYRDYSKRVRRWI